MPTYNPSKDAVLLKQFRSGSNNYYFEESYLSGSSVLFHTDITGSVTGSNFTLEADTGDAFKYVVYQDAAFKVTSSGASSSMVYRTINTNSAFIVVTGFGSQTDLDNATITFTSGNTVTFSSLGSLRLYSCTTTYAAGVNTSGTFSYVYPELNGQTSQTYTQLPILAYYNNATPSVIQGNTLWNITNSSGIVTVQKTGLTGNPSAGWKIIF